jgi:Two component regulator propeller
MCLYADGNGDVWVGTASGGLSRIRNGVVVSWTPDQGLPGATVGSILEDNAGNLWIAGDNGIYSLSKQVLNQSTQKPAHIDAPLVYGASDGLRSQETLYGSMPSTWKARDGRLWFATIVGAAVVDPAHVHSNAVVPPVSIENVTFDSRPVPLKDGERLGPGSGNLESHSRRPVSSPLDRYVFAIGCSDSMPTGRCGFPPSRVVYQSSPRPLHLHCTGREQRRRLEPDRSFLQFRASAPAYQDSYGLPVLWDRHPSAHLGAQSSCESAP